MAALGLCQGCGKSFALSKYTKEVPYHAAVGVGGLTPCAGSNMLPLRKDLVLSNFTVIAGKVATPEEVAVITEVADRVRACNS